MDNWMGCSGERLLIFDSQVTTNFLSEEILPNFGFFLPFSDASLFLAQGASSLLPTLSQQLTATISLSKDPRTE